MHNEVFSCKPQLNQAHFQTIRTISLPIRRLEDRIVKGIPRHQKNIPSTHDYADSAVGDYKIIFYDIIRCANN